MHLLYGRWLGSLLPSFGTEDSLLPSFGTEDSLLPPFGTEDSLLHDLQVHLSAQLWRVIANHLLHALAALHRARPSCFLSVSSDLFSSTAQRGD